MNTLERQDVVSLALILTLILLIAVVAVLPPGNPLDVPISRPAASADWCCGD